MTTHRYATSLVGLLLMVLLSACDQQDDVQNVDVPLNHSENELPLWLDGEVDMTPQEWLVKRSIATVDNEHAEVQRAAELLVAASERYGESHRMIANRSAQLEDMLQEQRFNETAVNLLDWFVELPVTQSPHSYSAICQYYFNLRTKGLDKLAIQDSLLRM